MKNSVSRSARQVGIAAASLTLIAQAQATTLFSDNFTSGASPSWGNDSGSWVASGGVYKATVPNFQPAAVSSLPFNLTDFMLDVDINSIRDGGIFLRSTPQPGTAIGIQGVLLNLKNPNPGFGNLYFHIVTNGTAYSPLINQVNAPYAAGSNPHLHIEVSGNTYSVFLNGSSTPVDSLTTSLFANGGIALYDNDGTTQSYDNVLLQDIPEPSSAALIVLGGCGVFCLTRAKRAGSVGYARYKKKSS